MKHIWLSMLFLCCTLGCSVGPSYKAPETVIPCEWKNKDTSCENCTSNCGGELVYLDYWWEVFNDPKLNELEALVLENNRDLFVAYERVREFRALMGIAAADFYPQLTLNPLYSNTSELIKNYTNIPKSILPFTPTPFRAHELLYFLPLNLSYEVDLWGRIDDNYQAAKYNWRAQQEDYTNVMLTLTSDLAFAYFQLRANDKQIDLLKKMIEAFQKEYQINLDRYEGNIILYADVALAAEEVGSAIIQYEEVLRQRNILEDQIAVLVGTPASLFCLEHMPLEGLPPCIPDGIPSEVLFRRPDIAEAEYRAKAANKLVKAAYTGFYPSLILYGTAGFQSPTLSDFMKWISRYWMLEAQSDQLVFDGFRTPYEVQFQIERFKEASGEYQQQVLVAFQEVEDALNNLDLYAKQYDTSVITTQWAQKAYQLYSDRYQLGVINYIDVVLTERSLLNFEISVNALQGYRYMATVELIKALGGGWSIDEPRIVVDDLD